MYRVVTGEFSYWHLVFFILFCIHKCYKVQFLTDDAEYIKKHINVIYKLIYSYENYCYLFLK